MGIISSFILFITEQQGVSCRCLLFLKIYSYTHEKEKFSKVMLVKHKDL